MLKRQHSLGVTAALRSMKLSNAMGAEVGVMPKGDEQTHGTDRIQYARRSGQEPDQGYRSTEQANAPAFLWDNFTSYDQIGPGMAHGYGQEVIG